MKYKVCILAAGVGSRMGDLSAHVSKAVLPINFKAVISYIINKFSTDIEIVIAVGHKKETIIDYLSLAHPENKITYVEIDRYVGPGSGPGYSLLQCKDKLQCPFIFFAADTIVLEDIPLPDKNWFGIAPVKDTEKFCTVKIKNNLIYEINDKVKTNNKFAFIGLAGICDYTTFFDSLENNKEIISGEIQVSNGFKSLIEKKLVPIGFTWFDTGSYENYKATDRHFSGRNAKFDFSKGEEFIYFINGRVIKYFADAEIVQKRCKRAEMLGDACPRIEGLRPHYYSYREIEGQTLYSILNNQRIREFLDWAKQHLWHLQELQGQSLEIFRAATRDFYYAKTMKRFEMFYAKKGTKDQPNVINGDPVPSLRDLLKKVNWNSLIDGIPSVIHGDLQFDNILVPEQAEAGIRQFILLDWRHEFSGILEYGDLYYDLAKLYAGMTISYQLIKEGMFSFEEGGNNIFYNFYIKHDLAQAKEEYLRFLKKENYDIQKIQVLEALIFLNMSPLHQDPFDSLLYYLGKNLLQSALLNTNPSPVPFLMREHD